MKITLSSQADYCLNEQFSIKDCTYACNHQGIIFSPINSETLLCGEEVISFLGHIEQGNNAQKTLANFWNKQPTYAKEVIEKLLAMRVIQLRE